MHLLIMSHGCRRPPWIPDPEVVVDNANEQYLGMWRWEEKFPPHFSKTFQLLSSFCTLFKKKHIRQTQGTPMGKTSKLHFSYSQPSQTQKHHPILKQILHTSDDINPRRRNKNPYLPPSTVAEHAFPKIDSQTWTQSLECGIRNATKSTSLIDRKAASTPGSMLPVRQVGSADEP